MWFGGHWLFMLLWIAIILPPFWQIFSKAGFSSWISLLMLIPLANLMVLYIVASTEWPALKPAATREDDQTREE
jgi:hypothetical protein